MAQITLTESKKEKLAQKYIDYICKRHGLDQESRAAQLIYFAYMHGINNCLDELNRKEKVVTTQYIDKNSLIKEGEFPYNRPADTLDGEIENIWEKLSCDNKFTATKDGFHEVVVHFVNWYKKQDEQNSAWSDEDIAVLDALIRRLEGEDVYISPLLAAECLKSLKDRVQPQPKQEWSVEDRSKVQRICKYLNEVKKYCADITEVRECIEWLKALIPQNT